jgi:hypothetical protein
MQDKRDTIDDVTSNLAPSFYDEDFVAWTQHQATMLREGKWDKKDLLNLAEELESLGNRVRRELSSRLRILVVHLLKWRYQPERRIGGHSWENTINTQRNDIDDLRHDSPSLRPQVQERLTQQYGKVRRLALRETRLAESAVPESCPWTVEQVLDDDFWPDAG